MNFNSNPSALTLHILFRYPLLSKIKKNPLFEAISVHGPKIHYCNGIESKF
jgi:hypothetical protein